MVVEASEKLFLANCSFEHCHCHQLPSFSSYLSCLLNCCYRGRALTFSTVPYSSCYHRTWALGCRSTWACEECSIVATHNKTVLHLSDCHVSHVIVKCLFRTNRTNLMNSFEQQKLTTMTPTNKNLHITEHILQKPWPEWRFEQEAWNVERRTRFTQSSTHLFCCFIIYKRNTLCFRCYWPTDESSC